MDLAFVGPFYSDEGTKSHSKTKHTTHKKRPRHPHVQTKNNRRVRPKSFAASSQSSLTAMRGPNLKHIASKYDNLYKTLYYLNLIPKNDTWIHAPLQMPDSVTPSMQNHVQILDSFTVHIPDDKHAYSSHIGDCLRLFNALRSSPATAWTLQYEKQPMSVYTHCEHVHTIKSHAILPFAAPIITGIVLNIDKHRRKYETTFESQQFVQRLSMFSHVSYEQHSTFDQVLINFIYPLSDGSILIGCKTVEHEQFPSSASSCRAESNIHLWHIVPNFDAYDHETDWLNHDYLHSSVVTYYNHLQIESDIDEEGHNMDIEQYLLQNAQCVLCLKHYIKSIWHTIHRPGCLHIPPFPMLQMLGIEGIYVGRNSRGRSRNGNENASHSLSNHEIESRRMSFDDACHAERLLLQRFASKQRSVHSSSSKLGISGRINLERTSLVFSRNDWINGNRFRLRDVEISASMLEATECKQATIDSSSDSDDEYGLKRKTHRMLSFRKAASCITAATMAVSDLLQQTHACSASHWFKLNMKAPSGLSIYEHVSNRINSMQHVQEQASDGEYYHHMGCAIMPFPPRYIFDFLADPLCRFHYDILVNTVHVIEKLDDKTHIVRLLHANKQCFLKNERETLVIVRQHVVHPNDKYVIAAVSIEHPAYPTRKDKEKACSISTRSGCIRTDIRSSGWIIEALAKNKQHSRVSYIMNIDFGGNIPATMKRNVAKKQPFAIYHLAKALKLKQARTH